jgi:NitT/TauT family transport system permease protein
MNRMMWRSCAAGLLTVIIIGLIVEKLTFRTIEHNTVQKWGTQS